MKRSMLLNQILFLSFIWISFFFSDCTNIPISNVSHIQKVKYLEITPLRSLVNKIPVSINQKEMIEDLNYLKYFFFSSYISFDDYQSSGLFDFNSRFKTISNEIDSHKSLSIPQFFEILYSNLSGIPDRHVELLINQDGGGFYPSLTFFGTGVFVTEDKGTLRVSSSINDKIKKGWVLLKPEGKIFPVYGKAGNMYQIGLIAERVPGNLIELQFDTQEKINSINDTNNTRNLYTISTKVFKLTDKTINSGNIIHELGRQIYIRYQRIGDNTTAGITWQHDFLNIAQHANDYDLMVIDLRQNPGGDVSLQVLFDQILTGRTNVQNVRISDTSLKIRSASIYSPAIMQTFRYFGIIGDNTKLDQVQDEQYKKNFEEFMLIDHYIRSHPVRFIKSYPENDISWILDKKNRENQYLGKLIVLVDSISASAAELFTIQLRQFPKTIVIGSNTAGFMVTGGAIPYLLPNSKITVVLPYTRSVLAELTKDKADLPHGIEPDCWVASEQQLRDTLSYFGVDANLVP